MLKLFTLTAFMVANLSFGQVTSIPTASGSGASTFDNIGSGTNTSATMTCGAGCTLVTTAGVFRLPNGTSAPGTCTVGDVFFDTDAAAGSNFYGCTSTNTWTLLSGSGSGASYPSALRCDVERTDSNTLTVFAGASSSQPCIVGKTSFTAAATLDTSGTAATGTYRFEVRDGVIYARLPGATTGLTAGGLTLEASSVSFSADAVEIWLWDQTVAGTWDAGTGTDRRAWLTTQIVPVAGTGLSSSDSGGKRTLNVDSATTMLLGTAQTSTAKKTFSPTASDAGAQMTCATLPSSPANGDIACDSGDSDKVKVRSNGAWVEVGSSGTPAPTYDTQYDYTNFGFAPDNNNDYVLATQNPMVRHWANEGVRTIKRIAVQINAIQTASEATRIGFYTPGCGTKLAESDAFNGTGSGIQYIVFGTAVTLQPGTYCIMIGTNSPTLALRANGVHTAFWNSVYNAQTARQGYCTSGMTGSGATATLPSSCGTINTGTVRLINLFGIPN